MLITKTHSDAILPTRKHPKDAGLDLYAHEEYFIPPFSSMIIDTGIAVALRSGTVGLILPKSKNDHLIGAGVVDENYRGSLLVKVVNYHSVPLYIAKGDGIAQLLITLVYTPVIEEIEYSKWHTNTDRGDTGGIVTQYKTATFTTKVEPDDHIKE